MCRPERPVSGLFSMCSYVANLSGGSLPFKQHKRPTRQVCHIIAHNSKPRKRSCVPTHQPFRPVAGSHVAAHLLLPAPVRPTTPTLKPAGNSSSKQQVICVRRQQRRRHWLVQRHASAEWDCHRTGIGQCQTANSRVKTVVLCRQCPGAPLCTTHPVQP